MWAVFFTQANPPAIVIKSLYPQLTGNELTAFEYQFALNDEGMLSNNFLNALRSYDLTWNGLILIDDAGLHGLSRYILEEGSGENTQAGLPVIMGGMLEEYALYDRLCLALPVKTSPPNWDNIVPNHVRSDLPLEYAKIFWAFMSVPQIHCEMIPLQ
jgi:hypothetical protein